MSFETDKAEARDLRLKIEKILALIDNNIVTKFKNINAKTVKGHVPTELWQKRTSRSNRVLLPWKHIYQNNLTIDQIITFKGGVCVEFVNDDYFNPEYNNNDAFKYLKNIDLLGGDGHLSTMISFRVEDGDSGARIARESYDKFKQLFQIELKPIERNINFKWSGKGTGKNLTGNSFIKISGGKHDSIESHKNNPKLLFNPSFDYANDLVMEDIQLVLGYFMINCFDISEYDINNLEGFKNELENYLKRRKYDDCENLLDYCLNHPSLKYTKTLIDPIESIKISIKYFNSKYPNGELKMVIAHNEAVDKCIYKFDKSNNFILSPGRPTNLFWLTHNSNMIMQNDMLDEFFAQEDKRVINRYKLQQKKFKIYE